MLRFHLPPNLASAAPRDAIALRVDLDLSAPPPPELIPALVLLQRWSGAPTPPQLIQLNRHRMRELVAALQGQPVFYWNNVSTPIGWNDDGTLSGVSIFLTPPTTAAAMARAAAVPKTTLAPAGTPMTVDGSEHFLAITLPSREHSGYAAALDLLKTSGFILEPANRKWWLRDRHKTLNFLATHGTRLRDEWRAEFTPVFEKNTARIRTAEIQSDVTPAGDAFEVTVGLRAGSATPEAIRSAVASNRGYLETDGRIYLLDAAKMKALATAQSALANDPAAGSGRRTHRISAARTAEAQDILETLSPGFQPPATWRARSEALRNLSALQPAPLPKSFTADLRPYQKLGVAWLWHLQRHDLGGILADEMGLGKTLQALALLSSLNARGAALVICPASLLENWRREAARFAPQLRVFVHHGDHRLATARDIPAHDLIITSYGTLTRDQELFMGHDFACIVADEAQHIKNRRSQNAAALRSLRARSRFLLTGTPVENSLEDLRSLFEFLLPGYLERPPAGLRPDERAWYDQRLRARVAPYILRRTKQAVAPELPAKLEQIMWCELTPAQAALYRETQQSTERHLLDLAASGASEASLRLAMLTQLLRLRQVCCDPRLLPQSRLAASDSAKLEAFRELLAEAVDDGHRLLVFSQFTSLLGLLREELVAQEMPHCYLDGSLSPKARQAEVDRFQQTPDIPVFLISLKAGGTGLNLTAADTVVHFDPWWNPAAEAQATDRAHRIGQTKVVTSYKLIASGTVEEKVLALQDEKRALLADVFEASDAAAAQLSLSDLKSLLA
ncbi:MAG: DEAD/DEAH box helicase [Verrucomicrobia bacterium]|nr:DEAD/DEAH box helicase [Verrucomicrobiota bacterium]